MILVTEKQKQPRIAQENHCHPERGEGSRVIGVQFSVSSRDTAIAILTVSPSF
jgi:hypothetical protein